MGAIHFSIDASLVELLKSELSLEVFVETGTFEGKTLQTALLYFSDLYSTDVSETCYAAAQKRFAGQQSVHLFHEDSPIFLAKLQPCLRDRSVLYWLDAHWCAAENAGGEGSQCPLLAELEAIESLNGRSLILIDDARLYLSPPPAPHEISHWPLLDQVIKKIYALSQAHEMIVINDVIVFFPHRIQKVLWEYAHWHSINWLTVLDKSRDYDLLHVQLIEKEQAIAEKEQEIARMDSWIAEKERLILELRKLRDSAVYRTAFMVAHPGRLLRNFFQQRKPPQP